ncbi:MAG: sugar transferase [Candidatus Kapaibacterium sp.]
MIIEPPVESTETYLASPPVTSLDELTEERLRSIRLPAGYLAIRRGIELFLVILSLPITLPICLLIALAIRLDSSGPVFYWQKRPGKGGRIFKMVKFRSMRYSRRGVARLTEEADQRVTRLGRFLRLYHLDELPQLLNVLRGEMSLVGPRPEPTFMSEVFERNIPFYEYRRLVPPGMTGWSQINQGYTHDIDSTRIKLHYDLYYIENLSPRLDFLIACKTVPAVLTRYGAR